MASCALVPAAQAVLAPEAEAFNFGEEAENRQYQQILCVAESQERRLVTHRAIRRKPGYDLNDPWLVVGDEDAPAAKKRSRCEKLVPGMPCLVVGCSGAPVAYLGPSDGGDEQCSVRDLSGIISTHSRRELMPMPTRPARQGDWALPVGLTGEQSKFNGMRGICGLVGQFQSGDRGIWISFEPADPTHPPEIVLIAESNLVSLPTPPAGAPRTPWDVRTLALPSSSSMPMLTDESVIESRLALFDGDDSDDGEDSVELSDSSEEEDLVLAPGALVALHGDLAKADRSKRYWRVEKLLGDGDLASAIVRLLDGKPGTEATHKAKDLALVSEKDLGLAAICHYCKLAEPENELLMCEHFSTSCLGCAHIGCLLPALKKVPKGSWFCKLCVGGGAVQPPLKAIAEAAEAAEPVKPKAKAKVDASVKTGKAKASAKVKAAGKKTTR